MSARCVWCNRGEGELIELRLESRNRLAVNPRPTTYRVHAGHREEFLAFHGRLQRFGGAFLAAILGFMALTALLQVLILVFSPSLGAAGVGLSTILLGAVLIALPFATPETVARLGVRTSTRLARAGGAAVIGFGVYIVLISIRHLPNAP